MQRPPKNLVGLWSLILYNSQTFFCPRQIPGLGIFLKMAHLRLPKVPFGERRSRTVCSDCMAGVQGTCEHCSTNLYIYVYKYTPLFEMWLTARRNTHTLLSPKMGGKNWKSCREIQQEAREAPGKSHGQCHQGKVFGKEGKGYQGIRGRQG